MQILSIFRRQGLFYMNRVERFFQNRSGREKILLSFVLLFLFFIGYFKGVLQPLEQNIQALQHQYRKIQHQAFQLSENTTRLAEFTTFLREGTDRDRLPLILSETASAYNVRITNTAQEQDQIQVWMEPVHFNLLLEWLNLLRERYGVVVAILDIAATDKPGEVNVQQLSFEYLYRTHH